MDKELLKKGKDILNALNANGFEAYLIGDIVKSTFANTFVLDAEVTTIAQISDIKNIFVGHVDEEGENYVIVTIDNYKFKITPFKNDPKVKPNPNSHYSKNLINDIALRDFTFNAIIMSHSGNIKDFYHGKSDIKFKTIRTINKPAKAIKKDPSIILKAFRYMAIDGFHMSSNLKSAIRTKAKLLKKADVGVIDEEMYHIYNAKGSFKAIRRMQRYGVCFYTGLYKKVLYDYSRRYKMLDYEDFLAMCFVLNEGIDERRISHVTDIERFKKVYNVALTNPKCKFDILTMYSAGKDVLTRAWRINKLLKRTNVKLEKIMEEYDKLPIHKTCDLAFKGEDILALCEGISAEKVLMLVDEVVFKVLNGELPNNREQIKDFITDEIALNKDVEEVPIIKVEDIPEEIGKQVMTELEEVSSTLSDSVSEIVNTCIKNLKDKQVLLEDDRVLEVRLRALLMDYLESRGKKHGQN